MDDKCVKCNVAVTGQSNIAKCSECNGLYHPGCCRIKTVDAFKKLGSRKTTWRCDVCKSETASSQSRSETETSEPVNILGILQEMKKSLDDNRYESRDRFDGLENVMTALKKSVEEFQLEIQKLKEDNEMLKQSVKETKEESQHVKKQLLQLRVELLDLQQYSRRHNIEIKGVPTTFGENIFFLLETIARVLNVPYRAEDFSAAHRLPKPKVGHPTIIVAFISRQMKDMWLTAAKQKRLISTDISPRLEPGPVYLNYHLTGHNKHLLGRAKQLVKDRKLAAAWTTEGKVLVRKAEGDRAVRVWFVEDLDNVVG